MRRWGIAALAVVAIVLVWSGSDPWRYAFNGLFAPPDLAQDLAAARMFASGQDPYRVGVGQTHAEILDASEDEGYPYFPHPPLAFLVFLPWAAVPLRDISLVWFCLSLGLLFVLAAVLTDVLRGKGRSVRTEGTAATTIVIFAVLLMWPPVLYNLAKGQWSILVAVLLALAWRFHRQERHSLVGACVGLATAVKLFPAVLCVYFFARARRALAWTLLVIAAIVMAPLLWMGPQTIGMFMQQSSANVTYWETFPAVTYSLHGVVARFLAGGEWARPIVEAPLLARLTGMLAGVALLAVALGSLRQRSARPEHEQARFAAWMALLVVLNPLAMPHTGVILALPILLVARALASDPRTWPKLAWTVAVIFVSLPGHTLMALVSQPIEPWEGVAVIALPLWGTLLLFIAGLAVPPATLAVPAATRVARSPARVVDRAMAAS